MKTKILAMAAMSLIGSYAFAQAQMNGDRKGPSATPGHRMQERGSVPGQPGASGYAPGHTRGDRDDRTTGAGGRDYDDRMRGDPDDRKHKGDFDKD